MSFIPSRIFQLEAARGNVANHAPLYKFGFNLAVGGTEDIWSRGGQYTGFITTASVLSVASSSAADDDGSTGAEEIKVFGLDSNYRHASEIITMNGTSTVNSTTSFIRVYRAFVTRAGSGEYNAGTITIQDASANVLAEIPATYGQTQMLIYAVEDGATLYFNRFFATVDGTKTVTFYILVRDRIDDSDPVVRTVLTKENASGSSEVDFDWAASVRGPADVWVRATNPSATSSVTATGIGMEIRND